MKKKFILYPLVAALVCVVFSSYHTGPGHVLGEDATGASPGSGCYCHGGGVPSALTTLALELDDSTTGAVATSYIPNHAYKIKITGTQTSAADSLPNFGFQVAVVNLAGAGTASATNAGTLFAPTGTYQLSVGTTGGASINLVEHSDYLSPSSGTGRAGTIYLVNVVWHSPAPGTGSVEIFGVLNAVNHNGGPDPGDHWHQTSLTLCEQVAAITGTTTVCQGSTTPLSDATGGGTWSSGTTSVATVTPGGVVTGVSGGAAVISYNAGCAGIATTTVNVTASPPGITGTLTVCQGSTTSLSDPAGPVGTWVSGATGIATVNLITGTVGGVVTGSSTPATALITYTATSGCTTSSTVTVNPLPAVILGTPSVCQGSTTNLTDATSGGTWSSSVTSVATVGSTGIVTGIVTGSSSPATTVITYTSPLGCTKSITVTVNPLPASIGGTLTVCPGATTSLSDATGSGTWASSVPTSATIGSTGIAFGQPPGSTTTIISYTLATGCAATAVLTVYPSPSTITGTTGICTGTTTTLNDATSGTWSSSNTTVATINASTGFVNGGPNPGGTSVITFTSTLGCTTTTTMTVSPSPAAITGTMNVCPGTTTTLSDATGSGVWASGNTTVATIGSSSGTVTGGATPGGTAIISYTSGGCSVTTTVTVNPTPPGITGTKSICPGATTNLNDATTGGTWTSSNNAIASVGISSGTVTGGPTPGGTDTITYTAPTTGCTINTVVTVNPTPGAITGTLSLCAGSTTPLGDPLSGGTWSSSNTTVATIGSTSGSLTGGANPGGNAIITYTSTAGCATTATVTVNPGPQSITGTLSVCSGNTTPLGDLTGGGTWSSSSTTIATVGSASGIVTGGANPGGNATITYTAGGCSTTAIVTVNPLPSAITGNTNICVSLTTTLGDPSGGGTWSSSSTTVASIGSSSGIATGGGSPGGTTVITYTLPTGCLTTTGFTVNPLPSAIGGTTSVCAGQTTNLTNTVSGGTWSSSNTAFATVNSASGVVTGVAPGTPTITYTAPGGCTVTTVVTVNPLSAITGPTSVCTGASANLADATTGGTWSSSNTAAATIIAGTGAYTGSGPGTSLITYTLPGGCAATTTVSVVSSPSPITGVLHACIGATTTLTDGGGGTWTSSNTAVATVGSTGIVTGVSANVATISYSLGTGCTVTATVTVNPLPGLITGTAHVCINATTTLNDTTTGGTWSSSNSNATVGSTSGIVTGITASTSIITYTSSFGCVRGTTVTINALPAAIGGTLATCIGATTTLNDPSGGGTWSSGSTGIATVVSGSGVVTGVALGSAPISYTLTTTGCSIAANVTVNSLPSAITGPSNVCIGSSITLSDVTPGGSWSSTSTSIATVGSGTGNVGGITANVVTINYSTGTGCTIGKTITVNALPSGIAGPTSVCQGSNIILSDVTPGGTWTSSQPGIATVSVTGLVNNIAAGLDTITYTVTTTGCSRSLPITVNAVPATITGTTNICVGATTTLGDPTAGGTWTSSNTTVASIGATTGLVTSGAAGSTNITYTLSTGCKTSAPVLVNPLPQVITGPTTVCTGSSITLGDITTGGTWTSGTPATATVSSGGTVFGVAAGPGTITYTIGSGCFKSAAITVNASPAGITGVTSACSGATTTLSDVTPSGTWSSSSLSVASVGSASGIVTGGATGGLAVITYKTSNNCSATTIVTTNPLPAVITGSANVCAGATTSLGDIIAGGTWSSGSTSIATVAATGTVSGVTVGLATITYTLGTGCARTANITVNPTPSAIDGATSVCAGSTVGLTDPSGSGSWSSSAPSVATIDASTGFVSALSSGVATISYSLASGCRATAIVTVNPVPGFISGTTDVCAGSATTLSDLTVGGTWASSATSVATIDSNTGTVSGLSASTATITYALPTGCGTTTTFTVNPLPLSITGSANVCSGATTTLGDPTPGGTWSSGSTGIATIGITTGTVHGIAAGTTIITYTLPTGCKTTTSIGVNASPAAIGGAMTICSNTTTTLTDATAGGTWSSGTASVATVAAGSGFVSGVSSGVAVITYTLGTGCTAVAGVSVNPAPAAIGGTASVCTGGNTLLTDATAGGSWASSAPTVAAVDVTGSITGSSAGTATITYALTTGCIATANITVNALPASISGSATVCVGQTILLSDATAGGTWSSSSASIASVNATTGNVTGVAEGTATITYTLPTGCTTTVDITNNCNVGVQPIPAAGVTVSLIPNPNNGEFIITASLASTNDEQVFVVITDVVGKVIYKSMMVANGGILNERIVLSNAVASGVYLLSLHTSSKNAVLRFVKDK